jgi:hypothetical protein
MGRENRIKAKVAAGGQGLFSRTASVEILSKP